MNCSQLVSGSSYAYGQSRRQGGLWWA